jgi:hypothetical protein
MYFYAECRYAECRYAKCRGAKATSLPDPVSSTSLVEESSGSVLLVTVLSNFFLSVADAVEK